MTTDPGAKLLDVLAYGAAVTVAATLLGGAAALAVGGDLVTLKVALFLVGFLLFGYASIALWRAASPRNADASAPARAQRERTPFEAALARVAPPLDDLVPLDRRLPPSVKLLVASLMVLGLSFAMETVFGVGVA